ncbi:hypothetical protein E6O75_ATG03556 [Venturia nashicola]|uniref:Nudix hydrolase domain-containing protein n=1 Tax=Venturia nashicola TaxID=86259 RepID=A0A4Z1P8X9_9PEZI|nr:hypothetical protein E6O75_ATG03556 [Venturia nashicola]
MPTSHLSLLSDCDSFPYPPSDLHEQHVLTYYHLRVFSYPETTLGYLLPSVALTLSNLSDWNVDSDTVPRTVTLVTGNNAAERTLAIAKTTAAMRVTGHWKVLDKWRGELYAVFGPGGEEVFRIERSASPLFGVVTYGVHLTAYTYTTSFSTTNSSGDNKAEGEKNMKIWVPRRSKTKQTYPGMLDNTVAGGITAGEAPFESVVREAMEEASLPEELVRKRAKAAGCVTYFHIRDSRAGGETGLLQPECQYVYDLDLTPAAEEEQVTCKPNDDEVEAFELLSMEEVLDALGKEEYKPNCAVVMIDFLVRHGIITRENERDYIEICSRLHRHLDFPIG